MAENVIQQSDVAVDGLYQHVIDSQKKFQEQTKSTNEDLAEQTKLFKDLTDGIELFTQKGLDKLMIARQGMNKLQKEAETLDKNSLEVQRKRIDVDKKMIIEKEKLRQQRLKETQQARRIIKLQQAEAGSVEALRAKLALVTNAWTKLTAEELKNTKRGQRLVRSKKNLTEQIKKLEKETGDHRREVGNYTLATDKLTASVRGAARMLGQFGLAIGGLQIIRSTIGLIAEFDEKLADISKTTGLTTFQAKQVSQALLNIDTRTSITNLQELASAAGRLGITGKKNIIGFAEAADKVFVALGDDLDGTAEEIATNLGKISNLFGLEEEFGIEGGIERVGSGLNELSASSKASAGAIQNFTNRMAGLSSILKLQDVQALGALFDEAGQSMEVASSTLSKLLPELSKDFERFAKVAGVTPEEFKKVAEEAPIEALKLVAEGAKSNEKGLFALTETLESYGIESARATGIVGVLTDNVDRLTELQQISTDAMRENTSITDEFNTKNQTLAAIYEKLVNKVKAFVLGSEGATAVSEGLKNTLAFLGRNLGTIVTILGKLIKAYIVWKGVMLTLKLQEHVKNFKAFGSTAKKAGEELGEGAKSAKNFGKALKGIGLSVAIGLLIELATALRDVVLGYDDARDAAVRFQKQAAIGSKEAQKRTDERTKSIDKQIRALERQREAGEITEKELLEQSEALLKSNRDQIKEDIRLVNIRKEKAKLDKEEAIQGKRRMLAAVGFKGSLKDLNSTQLAAIGIIASTNKQWKSYEEAIRQADADIGGANERLKIYHTELDGVTESTEDATNATKVHSKAVDEDKEKVKKLNTGLERTNEFLSEQIELLHELDQMAIDIEVRQVSEDIDGLIDNAKKVARETAELDVDPIESLINKRTELLKKAAIERRDFEIQNLEEQVRIENAKEVQAAIERRDKLLAQDGLTPAARKKILDQYDDDLKQQERNQLQRAADLELKIRLLKEKSNEEIIDITKKGNEEINAVNDELIDAQIEGAVKLNKTVTDSTEDTKKSFKELTEFIRDQLGESLDLAIENSKKKQSLIDDEIAKQKELIDAIRKGDAEGNVIAEKSLALEEQRLEERERAKRKEAKKEALLEEVKMLWNSINSFLDAGDSFPEAVGKGTAGTLGVKALANAISGFFKGTKGRLGDENKAIRGGKDGHLIWADSSEMIFNGGQVDKLENAGIYTTEDATKNAVLGAQLRGGMLSVKKEQMPMTDIKMDALTKEIKGMRSDLAARPTQTLSPWVIDGITRGLEVFEKKNGIEYKYLKPFKG